MEPFAQIQTPCHESWNNMKIAHFARHCSSCRKNVIDFTTQSREEIIAYLLQHSGEEVCGRIHTSQLDFSYQEALITIHSYIKKYPKSNKAFLLLSLSAILLMSCQKKVEEKAFIPPYKDSDTLTLEAPEITVTKPYEYVFAPQPKLDSPLILNYTKLEAYVPTCSIRMDSSFILGNIMVLPGYQSESIPNFPEIMPEFKGGIDSLTQYLQDRLSYPDWEAKNNIEGTLFVSFVIDKTGKIKDPTIKRSVEGSRNLDSLVIQVLKDMPHWVPGMSLGKPVDAQIHLPIRFKL